MQWAPWSGCCQTLPGCCLVRLRSSSRQRRVRRGGGLCGGRPPSAGSRTKARLPDPSVPEPGLDRSRGSTDKSQAALIKVWGTSFLLSIMFLGIEYRYQ